MDKNTLSVALKSSKKEIKEITRRFEKKLEMGDEKIVELAAFKRKKLAEERETLIQQRKASKKEKKAETKAKADALSDKQMEITDMFEDEDTKTMLNVSAYDFFDTLKDFNENDSNLSCQEPTDSLSLVTASSLVTLPTLFAALLPFTPVPVTSTTFLEIF